MSDPIVCPKCTRELTGAIEIVPRQVGNFVYLVTKETSDCNWRKCRGCKTALCKNCDDEQQLFCCEEGRIVARERAGTTPVQEGI